VSTGTITIAQPKSAGLTYSIDGVHYQTDTAFPKLAAGTYTLTVKNGSTCLSSPTTAVVNPQPVTPAQPTVTITQPSCAEPKGTIVLTSHDTGVVYSIFIGDDFVTYTHFTNLVPGTYHPNVKNGAGCGSAIMVSVVNPAPSTPAAPALTITQPTCTVGTGTISISSPIDSFTYSINNANYQSGGSFTGVAAGSYPVTAENSEGCISSPSTAVILTPPAPPPAPGVTVAQPTCSVTTGSIDIAGPLGPGLLYSVNGKTWQPDTSFSGLAPGSYPVTAKDSAGCVSSPASAIILTEPASCNLVVSIYPNPYAGEVNFTIVSPESGKGLLMFYNLLGEKMSPFIETDFVAGIPTSINCPMGFAHRQAVIYQLTIGKKKMQGTLLPQKF
jgi:hypothetical protein